MNETLFWARNRVVLKNSKEINNRLIIAYHDADEKFIRCLTVS